MRRAPLSFLSRRIALSSVPISVNLEIASACNLDCLHCVRARTESQLPMGRWMDLLDELREAGTLELTVTGGEPLIRDNALELMLRASSLGFAMSLFTNGSLVNEVLAESLGKLRMRVVQLSLYGPDAETHDMITRVSGSFESLCAAAHLLRRAGVRTRGAIMVLSQNMANLERTCQLAGELFSEHRFDFTLFSSENPFRSVHDLRVPSSFALWADDLLSGSGPRSAGEDNGTSDAGGCNMGRNTACIAASGDVFPCILFRRSAGNIQERSFGEIWSSKEMDEFRKIASAGGEGCRGCPLVRYCHGCPGFSVSENLQPSDPPVEACRLFRARSGLL
ncbi:MAG: hypothetical protein CVV64_09660 [Candidatus Wallbacteria bacterium HGW-Wallbacteria-1]|jgi:radical SAM protein with 4Fe4S-binding SPASM domain|uniref:Radical SAM core domain-containing protein n=1 Tax=Candidatus Wallbacteria bacterium HGW-Wallbacteria-1 TaxID=2013854 RepID=A0A2N1PQI9_9BACT|nr:MAG: hypothetical protein CVV64_09660 [Candidatus Wallbacteria bacterium HGW-Wallbacteria-1]